jgi:hypothetical protein
LFDNDDNDVEPRAVLFDYVDDGINVKPCVDNEDRAVCWRQQKRATVDAGITKELDVKDVVVAKGLVARLHFPFLKYLFLFFLGKSGKIFYFTYFS